MEAEQHLQDDIKSIHKTAHSIIVSNFSRLSTSLKLLSMEIVCICREKTISNKGVNLLNKSKYNSKGKGRKL